TTTDNIEEPLKDITQEIQRPQHSAICHSGGGSRSATFGLGVLKAIARTKLLKDFFYLSTVSGGGCVGGWLSAWIHRHHDGIDGVVRELPNEKPRFLLSPEPEPITHLRSYSNYLTPRLGLLSADSWAFVAIIARNLILIRYSCVGQVDKVDANGKNIVDQEGRTVQVPAADGTIIYIKPVFYGDEPRDIYHYAMTHDTFPHETTADQWFTEAQFESYRMLGSGI